MQPFATRILSTQISRTIGLFQIKKITATRRRSRRWKWRLVSTYLNHHTKPKPFHQSFLNLSTAFTIVSILLLECTFCSLMCQVLWLLIFPYWISTKGCQKQYSDKDNMVLLSNHSIIHLAVVWVQAIRKISTLSIFWPWHLSTSKRYTYDHLSSLWHYSKSPTLFYYPVGLDPMANLVSWHE